MSTVQLLIMTIVTHALCMTIGYGIGRKRWRSKYNKLFREWKLDY